MDCGAICWSPPTNDTHTIITTYIGVADANFNVISDELSKLNVENVYLYIGDAVRWDSVPDRLLNSGMAAKSVASGIHSPTSIASIVSGTHLYQHGVENFNTKINPEVPNLLDNECLNTYFINSINNVRFSGGNSKTIITTILNTSKSEPEALETIEEPFFVLERGPGGHAPYVRKSGFTTGKEYFESVGAAPRSRFRDDYNNAVTEDIDWYFSRVATLADRGALDDTLVIYVSDHGELLGEGGMIGHTFPIHEKHVYVPTIFIHDDLADSGVLRDGVVRHVDIVPTVLSLLDCNLTATVSPLGKDLTTESPVELAATFHVSSREVVGHRFDIKYSGVWDKNGGYVFAEASRTELAAAASRRLLNIPWREYARDNLGQFLYSYFKRTRQFGSASFSLSEGRRRAKEMPQPGPDHDQEDIDVPKKRLEELGYIE